VEDVQAPLLKRFSQMKTPINKTPEQGEFIEYQQNFAGFNIELSIEYWEQTLFFTK
jgi:hypothetical protein